MKNFTFCALLILFFSHLSPAQVPQLLWANSIGEPTDNDMGINLIPDNNGNLFFYGRFSGTVDFDPGPGTTNLTAGGNADIVIGKYDPDGGLIWVKKIGGSIVATYNGHLMVPYAATVDNAGNLYLTGMYVGTVDIDPSGGSYLLDPPPGIGGERVFVASYTNNGDLRWGFGYGSVDLLGGYWNSGYSIKIDHAGDVVVSGMFHHTCDFDPSGGNYELTANGVYMDIFFAKYSSTGEFIWAKSIFGGGIQDTPTDLIIDSSNNIYLCGYMEMTADFDPSAGTATLTSNGGGGDAFLAKYNSLGEYQWAFTAGAATGYDVSTCLGFDHDGNICMVGYFRSTVDFDPSAATMNLVSTGTSNADAFISKYSTAGNLIWAKSFGGINHENMGSMIIDQYGRIIVTGDFWGSCDFDPSPITESIDIGSSPNAAFTTQFDNDGNFLNVMPVYGPDGYLFDHGMVMDNNENLYFTGGYEGTVDFDPSVAVHNLTASTTYQDIYMSKYQLGTGRLTGRIWSDNNSNGIQDQGETGLQNIKVELVYDRNNNNQLDPYDGIIRTISQADGTYEFKFMAQGRYLLRVLSQPGYTNTTPSIADADLAAGQVINAKDFGFSVSIIPIVCSDFSAHTGNDLIAVQWKTETEVNCKGYNLQRSLDGVIFENIAWIPASGTSAGSHRYSYYDRNILSETDYYYRLEEIDITGAGKNRCSTLYVRSDYKTGQVNIYPNPVGDILNISTNREYSRLQVLDMEGRKIKEVDLNSNERNFHVRINELTAGVYLIRMTSKNGTVFVTRMVKN